MTAEKETAEVVSAEATGQAAGVAASVAVVTARDVLPVDQTGGTFVGRVWDPARGVPVPVALRGAQVWDASELAGTSASLLEREGLALDLAGLFETPATWRVDDVRLPQELDAGDDPARPSVLTLLTPIDLQVVKACGVTFAGSMIE